MNREEWSRDHCRCFVCGLESRSGENLETHEIADGFARGKALLEPATWLRLCGRFANDCHQGQHGLHHKGIWPLSRQLALKKLRDPEHYNRLAVLRLKRLPDTAVTEDEVDAEAKRLEEYVADPSTFVKKAQ